MARSEFGKQRQVRTWYWDFGVLKHGKLGNPRTQRFESENHLYTIQLRDFPWFSIATFYYSEDIWLGRNLVGLELGAYCSVSRNSPWEGVKPILKAFPSWSFTLRNQGLGRHWYASFQVKIHWYFTPLPGECNLVLHADNKVVNTAQFSPDGGTLRFGGGFTSFPTGYSRSIHWIPAEA